MDEEPRTTWHVTQQQQGYGADADGRATMGYTVSFETSNGQRGSVFVPMSVYNAPNVRQRIEQAAQQMDAVSRLVG